MSIKIYILLVGSILSTASFAQKVNTPLREGNKLYKEKSFEKSAAEYNKALGLAPNNPLANYNMGNAQFRMNKFEEAAKLYDNTIANSKEKAERQKAYYNKGVSFSKQKKLEESIEAYKNALKLDPKDQQARENLQKALLEKKQQDQQQQKEEQEKKEKEKKNPKQQKPQDQQQQPKEQQSKLNKQQVEQLLKALEQKEKDVQKKLQPNSSSPNKPDKDW